MLHSVWLYTDYIACPPWHPISGAGHESTCRPILWNHRTYTSTSVECIGLLLVSVVSRLLFCSTSHMIELSHYSALIFTYSSFICGLSHSYSTICLPPSDSLHHTKHSFKLECVCVRVSQQHVPCIFSHRLTSEIMALNTVYWALKKHHSICPL